MSTSGPATQPQDDGIAQSVLEILDDMTSDWELEFSGAIGMASFLIADLEFESIDVVQLVVALEERFDRRDLPFETLLMTDGRYVDDLAVWQIVGFLQAQGV